MSPGWSRAATARARPRTTSSRAARSRPAAIRSARAASDRPPRPAPAPARPGRRGGDQGRAAGHLDQRRRVRDDHRHAGGHRLQRPAARTPRPGSGRPARRPGAARPRGRRRRSGRAGAPGRPAARAAGHRTPGRPRPSRAGPTSSSGRSGACGSASAASSTSSPLRGSSVASAEQVARPGRPSRAARRSASAGGSRRSSVTPSPTTRPGPAAAPGRAGQLVGDRGGRAPRPVGVPGARRRSGPVPARRRAGSASPGWVHGTASCTVTTSGVRRRGGASGVGACTSVDAAAVRGRRRAPRPRPGRGAAAAAGAAPSTPGITAAPTSRCQAAQPVTLPPGRRRRGERRGELPRVAAGAAGHRRQQLLDQHADPHGRTLPAGTSGSRSPRRGMATGGSVRPVLRIARMVLTAAVLAALGLALARRWDEVRAAARPGLPGRAGRRVRVLPARAGGEHAGLAGAAGRPRQPAAGAPRHPGAVPRPARQVSARLHRLGGARADRAGPRLRGAAQAGRVRRDRPQPRHARCRAAGGAAGAARAAVRRRAALAALEPAAGPASGWPA